MLVEGKGWYGGVRDKRGDWSFGPATLARALKAVEAWIRHEPFETRIDHGERMWRGDAMAVVAGVCAPARAGHSDERRGNARDRPL
jgi:hypothetical protein